MSQYKVTTASLTNGSANVTIPGDVTAEIDTGDIMIRVGEGIPYFVAAAPTYTPPDTTVVLTGNYAGTSGNGTVTFERDFLALDGEGLPLLSNGDLETPTIFTRAMSVLQSVIEGLITGTRAFTNILISGGSANFATLTQDSINVVEAGMVGNLTTSPLLDLNLASAQTAQQSLGGREFCYLCESDATYIDPYGVLQKGVFYSGIPTATGSCSLTDNTKSWTVKALAGSDPYVVYLTDGSNVAYRWVRANSATQLFWSDPIEFAPTSYKLSRPRFESNGLLAEAASTNLMTRSEEFDLWTTNPSPNDTSVTLNAAVAPDGTDTADKVIPSALAGTHIRYKTFAGAVNTTYTFSLFAKGAEYGFVSVLLANTAFGVGGGYKFDLTTGTVVSTSGAPVGGGIVALENGWYRCWVAATSDADGGNYVASATISDSAGSNTMTGDGTSGIYLWGAQVEAMPFPTSYIPTTTAEATRAASRCSIPHAGNVPSPNAIMSLITEFDVLGLGVVPQRPLWMYGETNRGIQVNHTSGAVNAHHSGGGQHTIGTLTPNVMSRYGWTWNGITLQGWMDGTKAPSPQTTNPISGTVMALGIGENGGGNWFLNGHIRSIAIFSRVNSDAEMRIYS